MKGRTNLREWNRKNEREKHDEYWVKLKTSVVNNWLWLIQGLHTWILQQCIWIETCIKRVGATTIRNNDFDDKQEEKRTTKKKNNTHYAQRTHNVHLLSYFIKTVLLLLWIENCDSGRTQKPKKRIQIPKHMLSHQSLHANFNYTKRNHIHTRFDAYASTLFWCARSPTGTE